MIKIVIKKLFFLIFYIIFILFLAEMTIRFVSVVIFYLNKGHVHSTSEQVILCIGDSFTYGVEMEQNEKYPQILQNMLMEKFPDRKYTVINIGLPGSSSGYVLANLKKWIKEYKPEIILLMTGWNCNDYDFEKINKMDNRINMKWLKFQLFLNKIKIYRLLKYYMSRLGDDSYESGYKGVTSMNLYNFCDYQNICLENLEKICGFLKKNEVKTVMLNYPQAPLPHYIITDKEYYHFIYGSTKITDSDYLIKEDNEKIAVNRIIKYVAKNYSVPLVDNAEAFTKSEDKELYLKGDHHPNAKGYRIMAENVYNVLLREKLI